MAQQNRFFTLPSGTQVDLSQIIEITPPQNNLSMIGQFGSYQYSKQPAFPLKDGDYPALIQAHTEYGEFEADVKKGAYLLGEKTNLVSLICQLISSRYGETPTPPIKTASPQDEQKYQQQNEPYSPPPHNSHAPF